MEGCSRGPLQVLSQHLPVGTEETYGKAQSGEPVSRADSNRGPAVYKSRMLKLHKILFYLVCEAIGTAATPGLLCQPRVVVKMIVEKQMECRLAGKTEVLGENLFQRHFCQSQNPRPRWLHQLTWSGFL
jgi:hypothetical protein